MEFYLPVAGFGGFDPWNRRGARLSRGGRGGFEHPLCRRGAGGCGFGRGGPRSMVPRRMHFSLDDMDDWISPADVLGSVFGRPEHASAPTSSSTNTNGVAATPLTGSADVANKNVFEVKLSVSDYKPETLNVKVENGVITVEGKYEETKIEKDEQGKEVISEEFVSRHFKRCFTIPHNAIEEKLECKMTADGQLVLSAPLKAIEPAPEPPSRSIPINVAPTSVEENQEKTPAPENTEAVSNEPTPPTPTAPMEAEKTN